MLLGFWKGQLFGAGLGVAAAGVLNLGCVYGYAYARYDYRLSSSVVVYTLIQMTIGLLVFFCVRSEHDSLRWVAALTLCLISTIVSLRVLRSKSGLWNALINKVKNKFTRHAKD